MYLYDSYAAPLILLFCTICGRDQQLTLMIGYKNDYSRPYQAGVWTGLLYVGSGLYALRSVRESTSSNQKW